MEDRKLILLETLSERDKHGNNYGIYKCFCGNEFKAVIKKVNNNRIKSCSCLRKTATSFVECKCGCGTIIPKYIDRKMNRYAEGHNPRPLTEKQRNKISNDRKEYFAKKPVWNKGKTYVFKKGSYVNTKSWSIAMRKMFGDKCMRCGWQESTCDVHHIIPQEENGPNTLENGIILCPNCHRLADNNLIPRQDLVEIRSTFPTIIEIIDSNVVQPFKYRMITFNNKTQDLKKWAREYNISYQTLWQRIVKLKWSVEKALTTPSKTPYHTMTEAY